MPTQHHSLPDQGQTTTTSVIGWTAVTLVTIASSFWAYWGINEAFHEGWCRPVLWMRLLQMITYLGPALVLATLAVVSVRWPRAGAIMFLVMGGTIVALIVSSGAEFGFQVTAMITAVPVAVGMLFLFGRPRPKRAALIVSSAIPLLIIIGFGLEPAIRVNTRFDDGDRGVRLVEGNEVKLLWAPAGPGWTRDGLASWEEAVSIASRLNDDGLSLSGEPQNIWRLPSREEIVRSLTRGGKNAGGSWNSASESPNYEARPDKESPLWDQYGSLIYLWTAEEESDDKAWIVVYHGGVFVKNKAVGSPSFGFRAVRDP